MSLLLFFKVRRVGRSLHKWIGLALGGLLMLVACSGALLVFAESFERWFAPQRYALTGDHVAQPLATYAARAIAAAHGGDVMRLQFAPGAPVIVWLRKSEAAVEMRRTPQTGDAGTSQPRDEHRHRTAESANKLGEGTPREGKPNEGKFGEARPREGKISESKTAEGRPSGGRPGGVLKIYLDPPTGNVLDSENPRVGLLATLRAFHTNLLMQGALGRNLIGTCGIFLLFLALSGTLVWWPLAWKIALRFRRGHTLSINLHQFLGAWIALPLTLIAFTGIYLAFPQQLRSALAAFAPMTPQEERRAALLGERHLDPDVAFAALSDHDKLKLSEIAFPNRATKAWRIEAIDTAGRAQSFLIDDASGAVSKAPEPQRGDIISETLRRLHMNQGMGTVWTVIAIVTGLSPILFFITGVLSWLNRRKRLATKAAAKEITAMTGVEVTALDL